MLKSSRKRLPPKYVLDGVVATHPLVEVVNEFFGWSVYTSVDGGSFLALVESTDPSEVPAGRLRTQSGVHIKLSDSAIQIATAIGDCVEDAIKRHMDSLAAGYFSSIRDAE